MPSEKPVIFSGPMVNAIIEGRKTQTRRVVKPQTAYEIKATSVKGSWYVSDPHASSSGNSSFGCPYGRFGDRLWVRETLREQPDGWVYDADQSPIEMDADDPRAPAMVSWAHHVERSVCSPIHMPRWASRVTLEITDVRVERLQKISFKDCIAEGIHPIGPEHDPSVVKSEFEHGWNNLNGKRAPWASNPWVWVLTFGRIS